MDWKNTRRRKKILVVIALFFNLHLSCRRRCLFPPKLIFFCHYSRLVEKGKVFVFLYLLNVPRKREMLIISYSLCFCLFLYFFFVTNLYIILPFSFFSPRLLILFLIFLITSHKKKIGFSCVKKLCDSKKLYTKLGRVFSSFFVGRKICGYLLCPTPSAVSSLQCRSRRDVLSPFIFNY